MRTIRLLQNSRGKWFVHTTSGGDTVSSEEDFQTPANAQRAFLTEGRHQPFARMVLELHGQKPLVLRKASPAPALDAAWKERALQSLRDAMRVRKTH